MAKLLHILLGAALTALVVASCGYPRVSQRLSDVVVLQFADGNPVDLAWLRSENEHDRLGNRLLVLDASAGTVSRYTRDGKLEARFGSPGTGPGELASPQALTASRDRLIYVADTGNDRVQVFDAEGNLLRIIGQSGVGPGELRSPHGIAIPDDALREDVIMVADTGNDRVQIFTVEGEYAGDASIPMPLGMHVHDVGSHEVVVTSGRSNVLNSAFSMSRRLSVEPFGPLEKLVDPSGLESPVNLYIYDDYYVADSAGQILVFKRGNAGHSIVASPTRHSRTIKGFDPPPRAVVYRDARPLKASLYVADGRRVLGIRELFDDPMKRFEEFRAHLRAGNAKAALKYIHPHTRARYKQTYADLGPERLVQDAARMQHANLFHLQEESAVVTFEVLDETDGKKRVKHFSMRWVRGFGGRWMIYEYW